MDRRKLFAFMAAAMSPACGGRTSCFSKKAHPTYDIIDYFGGKVNRIGHVYSAGVLASTWTLVTLGANEAKNNWTGGSDEHWKWDGNYLYNPGWWDNGTYYKNETTHTVLSKDGVDTVIATSGPQIYGLRYTKGPYTLASNLVITEQSSGIKINVIHIQEWSAPYTSTNTYMTAEVIKLHEKWSDDNQHPMQLVTERNVEYALNLGPAFKVNDVFPSQWSGELHDVQ